MTNTTNTPRDPEARAAAFENHAAWVQRCADACHNRAGVAEAYAARLEDEANPDDEASGELEAAQDEAARLTDTAAKAQHSANREHVRAKLARTAAVVLGQPTPYDQPEQDKPDRCSEWEQAYADLLAEFQSYLELQASVE